MVQVHIATFLFGLAGLFVLFTGLDAVFITFGRTLFAAIALLLIWRFVGLNSRPVLSGWVLLSGVLLAVHWTLFFTSIQVSTVAVGLLMFSTSPIFIALLEPLFFRESFDIRRVLPAFTVALGIVIMTGLYLGQIRFGAGVAWGLASSLLFALLQLLNRKLASDHSAASLALIQNGVACCVLLPLVVADIRHVTAPQWLQLVFLGTICTALAHTLYINSMRKLNAAVASLIAGGLEPVYGVILAALLYAQYPDINVLMGGAVVLLAVLYVSVKNALD